MNSADDMHMHVPVLVDRCVELLAPALIGHESTLVDATVGLGGHAQAVLERIPQSTVIGIDRDSHAIDASTKRLAQFGSRFRAVRSRYDHIGEVLDTMGMDTVDAILMDLGVSSMQIDEQERGFSYSHDASLDMRMDQDETLTAEQIVNTYTVEELTRVLRDYGEERFARRIAQAIDKHRQVAPITRSSDLAGIIQNAIPAPARRIGGNPAKRSFQGLRIEVNDELRVLNRALPSALERIRVGGRMVVLSYHSLEDRIVKKTFAQGTTSSAPRGLPKESEAHQPYLRSLTHGAEQADETERSLNPRSASVRLRGVERVKPTPMHIKNEQVDGKTQRPTNNRRRNTRRAQ